VPSAILRISGSCSAENGLVEERELGAIVVGIEVDALVEAHGQHRPGLPALDAELRPEIGAAPQRLGGGPVAELRRADGVDRGRHRASAKPVPEGRLRQVGNGPLDGVQVRHRIVDPRTDLLRGHLPASET
jgi:hypothetical protein